MARPGGSIRNPLIWTYERGTLQYDIICALILAFIFFVPQSCFVKRRSDTPQARSIGTIRSIQSENQAAMASKTVENLD